jgi:hypothetical protein
VCFEPFGDRGAFRCGVVIADQMNIYPVGDFGVDLVQELAELDHPVPAVEAGEDGAVGGIERGEQDGGAVTHVVIGAFFGHARHHRKCWL